VSDKFSCEPTRGGVEKPPLGPGVGKFACLRTVQPTLWDMSPDGCIGRNAAGQHPVKPPKRGSYNSVSLLAEKLSSAGSALIIGTAEAAVPAPKSWRANKVWLLDSPGGRPPISVAELRDNKKKKKTSFITEQGVS